MLCYLLAAAAGVLGFLARRRPGLTLAALPLASLAVLAGLVQGVENQRLLLALLAAAALALVGRGER